MGSIAAHVADDFLNNDFGSHTSAEKPRADLVAQHILQNEHAIGAQRRRRDSDLHGADTAECVLSLTVSRLERGMRRLPDWRGDENG